MLCCLSSHPPSSASICQQPRPRHVFPQMLQDVCQKSLCASAEAKFCSATAKFSSLSAFWDSLSPHLRSAVIVSVRVLPEVGGICEVLSYSRTEAFGRMSYKFIGANAPYVHLVIPFYHLLTTISGK